MLQKKINLHHSLAAQTAAAADISARLNRSRKQAGLLSLAAKNLSVLAVRIGRQAAGLKELSLFYDEFAQRSIKVSNEINKLAAVIALGSVLRWRSELFKQKVQRVLLTDPLYSLDLLKNKKTWVENLSNKLRDRSNSSCHKLELLLDELLTFMQSMQVIAINARIEAGSLPQYINQLDDLSSQIDKSTKSILQDVSICQGRIKEIL